MFTFVALEFWCGLQKTFLAWSLGDFVGNVDVDVGVGESKLKLSAEEALIIDDGESHFRVNLIVM